MKVRIMTDIEVEDEIGDAFQLGMGNDLPLLGTEMKRSILAG
jgi:hypothetical protein